VDLIFWIDLRVNCEYGHWSRLFLR